MVSESYIAEMSAGFHFECAHFMSHYPEGHINRVMHGHSYEARLVLRGPVDEHTGMVYDFEDLKKVLKELELSLDHKVLNEIPGLETPTAENIAKWIWQKTKVSLPQLVEVQVNRPTVGVNVTFKGQGL